jgi:Ni/Co efflux regulator RcnB
MMSKILQATLIAATMFAVAAPAFADPDDWRHDRDRHEVRPPEHRRAPHVAYRPGYVYAPPPVVYAPPPPPPVVAEPSINFVIPLHFR